MAFAHRYHKGIFAQEIGKYGCWCSLPIPAAVGASKPRRSTQANPRNRPTHPGTVLVAPTMTHTPPSEAAASSPSPYLSEGMLRAQANPECAFPDAVQVLSREVLRLRRDCPPTAEVEKLRHDRDAWKHKADTLGADLNRLRSLVPTTCDEQTTFDAVFNRLQNLRAEIEKQSYALRENADLHLHLSNIDSALREAGRPHRHKGDELERIRDLAGERDTLRNAEFRGQTGRVFGLSSAEWDGGDADGMPSGVGIYGSGDMGRGEVAYYERRSAAFPRSGPATIDGKPHVLREAVGPATGQPRTEVPVDAAGSGKVVEVGEAFRRNLANVVDCLPSDGHPIDAGTIKIAIRNLYAAVGELAKTVERAR